MALVDIIARTADRQNVTTQPIALGSFSYVGECPKCGYVTCHTKLIKYVRSLEGHEAAEGVVLCLLPEYGEIEVEQYLDSFWYQQDHYVRECIYCGTEFNTKD
jgi:hypothetical protein